MSGIAVCYGPPSIGSTAVTTVLEAVAERRPDIVENLLDVLQPTEGEGELTDAVSLAHTAYRRCRGDGLIAKQLEDTALNLLIGGSDDPERSQD